MKHRGHGTVFQRGSIWWVQYWVDGKRFRESSRSVDRVDAEILLANKLGLPTPRIDVMPMPKMGVEITQCSEDIPSNILRSRIGTIAELLVAADLLNKGFEVFRSICQHTTCDLIAMRERRLLRVEVKTGKLDQSGNPLVSLAKHRGRFDVAAIVTRTNGIFYVPNLDDVLKTVTIAGTNHIECGGSLGVSNAIN